MQTPLDRSAPPFVITRVEIDQLGETGTKAFASVTINDACEVSGIRVIQGADGLSVAMPSMEMPGKSPWNSISFMDATSRAKIEQAVLSMYRDEQAYRSRMRDAKATPGSHRLADPLAAGPRGAARAEELEGALSLALHALANISSQLFRDDVDEVFEAVTHLARIRFYSMGDLADAGAAILATHGRQAVERVIPYLGSDEENLRWLAVQTLRIWGADAVEFLEGIAGYLEKNPGETIWALLAIGEAADAHLEAALKSENPDIREAAALALDFAPPDTILRLIEPISSLLGDPDPEIRIYVLGGLERIGLSKLPAATLKRMAALGEDRNEAVSHAAEETLARMQREQTRGDKRAPA